MFTETQIVRAIRGSAVTPAMIARGAGVTQVGCCND